MTLYLTSYIDICISSSSSHHHTFYTHYSICILPIGVLTHSPCLMVQCSLIHHVSRHLPPRSSTQTPQNHLYLIYHYYTTRTLTLRAPFLVLPPPIGKRDNPFFRATYFRLIIIVLRSAHRDLIGTVRKLLRDIRGYVADFEMEINCFRYW